MVVQYTAPASSDGEYQVKFTSSSVSPTVTDRYLIGVVVISDALNSGAVPQVSSPGGGGVVSSSASIGVFSVSRAASSPLLQPVISTSESNHVKYKTRFFIKNIPPHLIESKARTSFFFSLSRPLKKVKLRIAKKTAIMC